MKGDLAPAEQAAFERDAAWAWGAPVSGGAVRLALLAHVAASHLGWLYDMPLLRERTCLAPAVFDAARAELIALGYLVATSDGLARLSPWEAREG
jgi:hypothetical protein